MVGVVSPRPSKTLMLPVFSATKTRPSGEKRTAVGGLRPLNAVVSWKPGSNPGEPVWKVWSLAAARAVGVRGADLEVVERVGTRGR